MDTQDDNKKDPHADLPPEVCQVMFEKGTERPFSSPLYEEKRKGTYVSAETGMLLFRSADKFDSGTGWPSFTKPIDPAAVTLEEDATLGMSRTEVITSDSGAHLGHVFPDGPAPTGQRFCMNGLALKFIPDEEQ